MDAPAADIVTKVFNLLSPHLKASYPGFSFTWSSMVVRELKLWKDLHRITSMEPYFGDCFMQMKGRSKTKKFYAPTKLIDFVLIVDTAQWIAMETYRLELSRANKTVS